jgi:CDP-glycerol glycerophosphotransferase (TagB/SpsB family)
LEHIARLLSYFGSLVSRAWLLPLYFLSGFFSRRPNVWVFGSWGGNRYSDNSAAFFEYCHSAVESPIRLVWISRKRPIVATLRRRGFEAHWIWSPRGIVACLTAGVYVFDSFLKDINFWLSRNAMKVNLWSGVPLKKCEREIDNPRSRYYRLFHGLLLERLALGAMMPWHVVRPDLVIATSELTRDVTCRTFDIVPEQVAVTGFPRNDILFSTEETRTRQTLPAEFAEALDAGDKIFLYLPTYRDSRKEFLDVNWCELDALMRELDAIFFLKFHPDHVGAFSGGLDRVIELPKAIDIYDLLPQTDALVSDYSSIVFDYMLLRKPIVYFVPDLEEFAASSRSFNFMPADVAAGPLCRTSEELLEALRSIAVGSGFTDSQLARWERIRRKFNAHLDAHSCERVLKAITARVPECAQMRLSVSSSSAVFSARNIGADGASTARDEAADLHKFSASRMQPACIADDERE